MGSPSDEFSPLIQADPVANLVYELMRRGSVTPETMRYVIGQVSFGPKAIRIENEREKELYATAQELCRQLPWYLS